MPRPCKRRCVNAVPGAVYFKPRGIPMSKLGEVVVGLDGFEALRLSDLEGLDQSRASAQMGISRQTYGRILSSARHTIAQALVHGMAVRIEGGNNPMETN